jgi:hypothetical protein
MMKPRFMLVLCIFVLVAMLFTSCDLLLPGQGGSQDLEGTRVALAIQQTSMAMEQTRMAQADPPAVEIEQQPTYTPYPTYTSEVVIEAPPTQEPPVEEAVQPTIPEPQPEQSFEDWLKDVKILVYNDMYGSGEVLVVENAIDGLAMGRNTTNVKDAMGTLLSQMNSATNWDLVIIAAERRDLVSGEYFDVLAAQLDRGSSIILEIWYLDDVSLGRIQPVMQRCGLAFQRDWLRDWNSDLNSYLVYLLEPDHPVFSEPNLISMLIPYDVMWYPDAGDLIKIIPGSTAVLLGGTQAKEYTSYGLLADCMEGRMLWQTFSTHDYKTQDMTNLWQNYIIRTLKARYAYLQE